MSLGVLNNLSAVYAENNLNNTNNSLNTVLQQLSSGSKINSGADDAAGLSLVDGLQANQQALTQSVTNATEGVGLLQVADGALSQVTSLLNRAVTLATEASNGTLNSSQDTAANQEYQSILSEISNIGSTTTYNAETVFGSNTNIFTGDSSTAGSSINDLNIRTLSASNVGDSGGVMSYSNGANNVFVNLSSSTKNAALGDTLNGSGTSTINVNYLVKGNGTENTATTAITVGTGTSYANTAQGLISAINNSGLGLNATFATQANAGVTGGGTQTGIEITGGLVSAGVDPSSSSTSGTFNASGIAANELLTQGQVVTVKVGGTTAAAITVGSSTGTLTQLAAAINSGTGGTAGLVTASVVTNSDGTQSLSLADTNASGGALSVTTTAGSAITPAFANGGTGSTASATSALSSIDTTDATGTAAVTAVDGALTVGVGSVSNEDSALSGSMVVTYTPASGSAVTDTFVIGAGTNGSGTFYTGAGNNTLSDLATTIHANIAGLTATAGTDGGTTALTLTGSTGDTVTTNVTGLTYTNTLTGATPAMSSASATDTATLSVAQANAGTDAMTGSIVLQNTGGTATTFVMGAGTDNATDAPVGGVAANTYYTGNATMVGADSSNSLAGLADTINQRLGTDVTASVGAAGLTVTSKTAGDNVTSSANTLANTNATLGLYSPTVAGTGEYATALMAVTNAGGTEVTGTIGSADNLTGSVVLTNSNGIADTFVMGNGPTTGTAGLDGVAANTGGGNIVYTGGNTVADLETAINGEVALTGDTLDLTATDGGSGGINLQSTVVEGGSPLPITMSGTLAVAQSASDTSSVTGAVAAAGTASIVNVAPASGSVNTTDTLTGSVVLTNTPTSGSAVTETFVLGGSGGTDGGNTGALSGTTFTVNGSTLSDLQAAINSQTTAGTGSLGLGLTALASTDGLAVSTSTNNGNTVGATSTLVDTTQGTFSSISMGSFASENDAVSGNLSMKVGTNNENINLTSGETVSQMISQINGAGAGVTASWVAPTGGNSFGSVELTANTANQNITTATEAITDTPTAANLSYTANSAYNMGLSGTIADSTTAQTGATFAADTKASSGTATISYTDAAGQNLSATDLSNQTDAQAALTDLNTAITAVAAQDGYIGAQINTLNAVSQVISTQQENVQSAQNAVQATDYAAATSNMSKYEILSQTGIAALAQANSIQQEVTKLLQ